MTEAIASRDLRTRMANLARDLESEQNVEKTLQHIVEATVELVVGCQAASILLATRQGEIKTSAFTDEAIARADQLQAELNEGPCVDAVWKEEVVLVPDLRAEDRWPRWVPRTIDELGFLSMTSVRLFTHKDRVGALNMFSHEPHAFTPDDIDEGIAIAAHAAVAMAAAEQVAGLELALDNRTMIGQATGIVMAYYGLSAPQAFQVLRRLSNEQNRKLADIARSLVEQHERDRSEPFKRP